MPRSRCLTRCLTRFKILFLVPNRHWVVVVLVAVVVIEVGTVVMVVPDMMRLCCLANLPQQHILHKFHSSKGNVQPLCSVNSVDREVFLVNEPVRNMRNSDPAQTPKANRRFPMLLGCECGAVLAQVDSCCG